MTDFSTILRASNQSNVPHSTGHITYAKAEPGIIGNVRSGVNDYLDALLFPKSRSAVPIPDFHLTRTAGKLVSLDQTLTGTDFLVVYRPRQRFGQFLIGRIVTNPATGRPAIGVTNLLTYDDTMSTNWRTQRSVSAGFFLKNEGIPNGAFTLTGRFNATPIHSRIEYDDFDADKMAQYNNAESIQGAGLMEGIVGLMPPKRDNAFMPVNTRKYSPSASGDLIQTFQWSTSFAATPNWYNDPIAGTSSFATINKATAPEFLSITGSIRIRVNLTLQQVGTVPDEHVSIYPVLSFINALGIMNPVPDGFPQGLPTNEYTNTGGTAGRLFTVTFDQTFTTSFPIAQIVLMRETSVDHVVRGLTIEITNHGYWDDSINGQCVVVQLEGGAVGQVYGLTAYHMYEVEPTTSFLTDVVYFDKAKDSIKDFDDALAVCKHDPNIKMVYTAAEYAALRPYFSQLIQRHNLSNALYAFDMNKVWDWGRDLWQSVKTVGKVTAPIWNPIVDASYPGASVLLNSMLASDEKLMYAKDPCDAISCPNKDSPTPTGGDILKHLLINADKPHNDDQPSAHPPRPQHVRDLEFVKCLFQSDLSPARAETLSEFIITFIRTVCDMMPNKLLALECYRTLYKTYDADFHAGQDRVGWQGLSLLASPMIFPLLEELGLARTLFAADRRQKSPTRITFSVANPVVEWDEKSPNHNDGTAPPQWLYIWETVRADAKRKLLSSYHDQSKTSGLSPTVKIENILADPEFQAMLLVHLSSSRTDIGLVLSHFMSIKQPTPTQPHYLIPTNSLIDQSLISAILYIAWDFDLTSNVEFRIDPSTYSAYSHLFATKKKHYYNPGTSHMYAMDSDAIMKKLLELTASMEALRAENAALKEEMQRESRKPAKTVGVPSARKRIDFTRISSFGSHVTNPDMKTVHSKCTAYLTDPRAYVRKSTGHKYQHFPTVPSSGVTDNETICTLIATPKRLGWSPEDFYLGGAEEPLLVEYVKLFDDEKDAPQVYLDTRVQNPAPFRFLLTTMGPSLQMFLKSLYGASPIGPVFFTLLWSKNWEPKTQASTVLRDTSYTLALTLLMLGMPDGMYSSGSLATDPTESRFLTTPGALDRKTGNVDIPLIVWSDPNTQITANKKIVHHYFWAVNAPMDQLTDLPSFIYIDSFSDIIIYAAFINTVYAHVTLRTQETIGPLETTKDVNAALRMVEAGRKEAVKKKQVNVKPSSGWDDIVSIPVRGNQEVQLTLKELLSDIVTALAQETGEPPFAEDFMNYTRELAKDETGRQSSVLQAASALRRLFNVGVITKEWETGTFDSVSKTPANLLVNVWKDRDKIAGWIANNYPMDGAYRTLPRRRQITQAPAVVQPQAPKQSTTQTLVQSKPLGQSKIQAVKKVSPLQLFDTETDDE